MPLTAKQNEYIRNANCRWNIKTGAVRSGKSYVDTFYVIPQRIRERAGRSGLNVIIGVTKETIERNVLLPMREIYGEKNVSEINSRNVAYIRGEKVYCLGAEKADQVKKIQGGSFKYCYGDEVAKWAKPVFDMLKSRLDKEYSCFDGSCNPESPTHWLKAFIDSDVDIYVQHYQIFDNTYLPKRTVENLCREYAGSVYYDRLILGKWVKAEGAIYDMFSPEKHLVDAGSLDFWQKRKVYVSCDYGTQNATVFLLWKQAKDGRWIAVKEYYHSGRKSGTQKTDTQYADDLERWLDGVVPYRIIIDPSAASFKTELKHRGYVTTNANNDVTSGIRLTMALLNTCAIGFDRGLTHLIDEIHGYSWNEKCEGDVPVKEDDHCMDAMRYFCAKVLKPKRGKRRK